MSDLAFVHLGFGADAVEYTRGWEEQRRLHADRVAGRIGDTVLLLEHLAVYTAGKRTEPHERPVDGTPVIDVDRGGKITWHGPGQLVGYPVVKLPDPIDVLAYVRLLEQVLIDACAELGLATTRIDGRSGVWVAADARGPARKVGAIGLRVAGGVSMHGFALNCDCTLDWSAQIVPCGISDAGTTTLARELGRPVSVATALPVVERHLRAALEIYSATPAPVDSAPADSAPVDPAPVDPPSGSKVSPGFRKGTRASTTACA